MVLCLDAANPRNFNLTAVEVLVVAGGGGGGVCYGGGGGAGGLIYNSNFTVTPGTQLTVTVGNGGTNQVNTSGNGGNGGPSVFGSLEAIGGGYGGGSCGNVGGNGGSGGGGSGTGGSSTSGGMGTSQQGTSGGTSPIDGGGGGGGAGSSGSIRQGGNGLGFNISGTFTYYGGGGSGGGFSSLSGGIGGGGLGGIALASGVANANVNTGGGGGGSIISGGTGVSGLGGSGIIIVRYQGPQKAIGGTVTSVGGDTIHTFTTSGNFTPLVNTNGSAVLGLSDLSGNRNFGDSGGSGVLYSSANGGSLSFDGVDDYVNCGNATSLSFTNNLTVSIWCSSNNAAGYRSPLMKSSNNSWADGFGYWQSSGIFAFYINQWNGAQTVSVSKASFSITNFVATYNGVNLKLYENGTLIQTGSSYTTNISNSSTNLEIGRGGGGGYNWSGNIAQVSIYNRALSAAEVSQNYNALRFRFGL